MNSPIDYRTANGIAVLTINRPEARNALNWSAQEQFAASVEIAAADPSLRVLIVTGAGSKAFASGGDIKELVNYPARSDAVRLMKVMGDALRQLTGLPVPVIAAVNGDAVGGGIEIVSACDMRLAAESARFCFAQVQVGLTSGWGGAARMIHLLGAARSMELMMTGRTFQAVEALDIGFLHRLTPDTEVMTMALDWASELQSLPKDALAAFKRMTWQSAGLTLDESYRLEEELFVDLWPNEDHLKAMAAFIDNRRPRFGGS